MGIKGHIEITAVVEKHDHFFLHNTLCSIVGHHTVQTTVEAFPLNHSVSTKSRHAHFTALIPPTAATHNVCFIMTSHSEPSNCSTVTCAASLSYYVSHSLLLLPPGLALFLCLACSLCVSEPLYDKSSPPCMLYWSRQASAKMPQTNARERCVGAWRRRGGFFNSTPSRFLHIAIYQC